MLTFVSLQPLPNGTALLYMPFKGIITALLMGAFCWKRLHCCTQKVAHFFIEKDTYSLVVRGKTSAFVALQNIAEQPKKTQDFGNTLQQ